MAAPERTPIHDAIDAAGNHPIKLLTLVALAGSMDTPLSRLELGHAVDDLQDENNPGYRMDGTTALNQPYNLCTSALEPAGLVRFTTKHVKIRRNPVEACAITEKGLEVGLPVAGAFLGYELDHPETSLLKILGESGGTTGLRRFQSTKRLTLYNLLLQHPSKRVFREDMENVGVPYGMALGLSHSGILETKGTFFDFQKRRITITAPPEQKVSADSYSGGLRLALNALTSFYNAGIREIAGGDLVSYATERDPDIELWRFRKYFLDQVAKGHWSFVTLQNPNDPEIRKKRYMLSPTYQDAVADLVVRYRQLLGSADAREEYRQRALEFLGAESRPDVSTLIAKARGQSSYAQTGLPPQWKEIISQLVPEGGISPQNLYHVVAEVTGAHFTYQSFRNLITNIPTLRVDRLPTALGRRSPCKVMPRSTPTVPEEFGMGTDYRLSGHGKYWRQFGACIDEDPELFTPLNPAKETESTRAAKAICRACSVKGDCLLFALDTGESQAIAGGLSPSERQSLSARAITWLRQSSP